MFFVFVWIFFLEHSDEMATFNNNQAYVEDTGITSGLQLKILMQQQQFVEVLQMQQVLVE